MEGGEINMYMYGSQEKQNLQTLSKNAAEGHEEDQATLAYYQSVTFSSFTILLSV